MSDRVQFRYDKKANWEKDNPILLKAEIGFEEDGQQYKLGDGIRTWKQLSYRGLPCLDQMGDDKLTPMSQDAVTREIKKLTQKRTILNVSQENENYKFAGKATARLAVPAEHRGIAQILIYQTVERLVIEYCVATDINDDTVWKADSSWKAVGSGGALNISEEKNNYEFEDKATARNAVQSSDRKSGQFITYSLKEGGWIYEQFTGTDISKWAENGYWNYYTTNKHLAALSDFLTETLTEFDTRLTDSLQNVNKTVDAAITEMNRQLSQGLSDVTVIANSKADNITLTEDNKLQLTSNGAPIGAPLELPSGILNLSYKNNTEFINSETARNAVKPSDRIIGQVITYKLDDGVWYFDQFIGETTGSWGNAGSWVQYALKTDLTPLLLEIEDLKVKFDSVNSAILGKIDGLESEDVDENNMAIVGTSNGAEVARIVIPKGGGGTGPTTGVVMKMKAIGATSIVVSKGEDAILRFNWTSIDTEDDSETGPGTLTVLVNNFSVLTDIVNQGDVEVNLKGLLNDGSNNVRIRVTDSYNNYRTLNYSVQVASLLLTSTFSDDTFYDREPVQFRYVVQGSGTKTIRFWLNGLEIAPDVTDSTNKQLTKNLTGLVAGTNSIRVVAESTIGGYNLRSNELYYEFINISQGLTEPAIVISFNKTKVRQFEIVEIPYVVYDPAATKAHIDLLINNVIVQTLDVDRVRQIWSFLAQEQGIYQMQIRCKGVTKAVTFEVEASEYDITEELGNLRYKGSSIGKSNSAEDRASWAYGDYDAVFSDFTWSDDGWQRDAGGNNHLRLIGDSKIKVGVNPFGVNILQEGMTFTVEFATQDVVDTNAVIMSCFADGVGIEIKPNHIRLKSAQNEISADLDSSKKVSVSFVVQRLNQNRLLMLYIDGIMSGTIQYSSTDNLSQSSNPGFNCGTGSRACITMVYAIRWYNNSLDFSQVFNNYVFDIENFDEKVDKYQFNNILTDFGDIDYTKALDWLPCLTIIGDLPTFKGDKKNCSMLYEDKKNPQLSWSGQNIQNDVQGTSSQAYPRKNYKFKFQENIIMTATGESRPDYSMLGTQIPAKVFCMKADFAESSGTHNTGMAVLVDESLRKLNYIIPPQATDARVRTTVFGYPCLMFHKQVESDSPRFLGKYNYNDDKSSTQVFGFVPGMECWEFLNNTSNICLFKGADWVSETAGKPNWLNDLEGRYPDGHEDSTNIQPVWAWVQSCIGNPTKFKAECKEHFNENFLVFYCLATELFGAVDQRAKNQMLTTYGERGTTGALIWYFIFYDNDTLNGENNEGRLSFDPYIETKDEYGSAHVWNGWNSELWTLVEAAYPNELAALYAELRVKNAMTLDAALDVFQTRQADKWSETVYNHDGQYKYIGPLEEDGDDSYLYALQGSRSRHRIWWLTNRFYYMDGKYFTGDYRAKFAHIRVNTPSGTLVVPAKVELNIRIGIPMYVRALVSSYQLSAGRGKAGQTYKITPPTIQYNNTEVFIYGARGIKSLGDLSGSYPGESVNVVECVALEDLIIGNTTAGYANNILKILSLGNNTLLRVINVANCKQLKQSLELGRCYSLRKVEARGSAITGVALPGKGILEELYLPETVTALYLKNQLSLTNFVIEGYKNLNSIVIDNVSGINGYNLVKTTVNTAGNSLSKVRLTDIDVFDDSSKTLIAMLSMTGEDDNGNATSVAWVTGKIHLTSISQSALQQINANMPYLTVTYDTLLDIIEFQDPVIKQVAVANFDTNGDGEVSANEVEFESWPETLLIGKTPVKFNELHFWKGTGSRVANVPTMQEISMLAGKTSIFNLPNLRRLEVYSNEVLADTPLLTYDSVTNCYSIQEFVLHGRYLETARGGFILARQTNSNGTYYRLILPVRGHTDVVVSEPRAVLQEANFKESTYTWGLNLNKLTIQNAYSIILPTFSALRTLQVTGFSELINENAFYFGYYLPILDNLIVDDTTNNSVKIIQINGGQIRNVDFRKMTCVGTSGSYLRLVNLPDTNVKREPLMSVIDLPATYKPESIRISVREWGSFGVDKAGRVIAAYGRFVIRANDVIPCTEALNIAAAFANVSIYVPDNLVAAYQAATNWATVASNFKPLSQLG